MNTETRKAFAQLVHQFHDETALLDYDFPHPWMSGFLNVIVYGETDHDDDNPYDQGHEQTSHSNYKKGARAAMILLKCPWREEEQ
jgi:hypothetical protein